MPDVTYDQATPKSRRFPALKFRFGGFFRILAIIALAILLNLAAAVIAGFISAFSGNIDINSLTLSFDPQITIAYLLVYYSFVHFYKITSRQSYFYLLFTLLLSFTTSFIQGSITMILLPPLLLKLRLIQTPSAQ
ncbi:MAG: hypothetical protein UX38_C0003G0052 [Microgenomates group bacterium GW2011_GWC1_46_16]|uniref:Uncharacterized protein n=2 Tax=Candidatus Collieribacteriota TaxID=1752725 RepID=A0A1F5FZ46_9BACT|nr:MAG: hypothetical protein UX32_C0002G0057 [Microgenomates group bacterium GW2011_GWF1_46_12]KKU26787.1 MAG: hypothetical protein UX38_C0003G0052 [Microgenomates group bacterium GW2011_GWC1_46_16]KKU28021.1 MAG: hypothetical protein UX40_C0004G0051 [Microgenomates group bacterium GW2011_GWF2_46_18]KKU44256.1 MAG: hypothetical protein UX59_C0002G0042 [Microgenomates group bacterium GW2011_GWA1_46_7]KKU45695.1 MAG: hypothetical protein UX63_C0002G0056 [Microgenomates group bacterium GW2011_GWB1